MKRFVFIQKDRTIPDQSGTVIKLRASSLILPDLQIPNDRNLHFVSFPLALKTETPEPDFHLLFRLPGTLVSAKIVLGGAYVVGDHVRASFINYGDPITLKEGETMLEAILVEDVRYFQRTAQESFSVGYTTATPAKKPRKKR